jgi:hypothetical protein
MVKYPRITTTYSFFFEEVVCMMKSRLKVMVASSFRLNLLKLHITSSISSHTTHRRHAHAFISILSFISLTVTIHIPCPSHATRHHVLRAVHAAAQAHSPHALQHALHLQVLLRLRFEGIVDAMVAKRQARSGDGGATMAEIFANFLLQYSIAWYMV